MPSILEGLSILDSLSEQDKEKLSMFCQERFLKKGDTLFKEGEEGNSMYFLKKGKIDIFKNINGEQVKIGNTVAEEVLGEMALFQSKDKTRSATGVASEDCLLVVILSFSIEKLKNEQPNIIEKIQEIIKIRNEQNSKFEV